MLASDFSDGSSVETQTYRKGLAHRPMESTDCEMICFARKRNLGAQLRQINTTGKSLKTLSSPVYKNIPLNFLSKSSA
jgi:hypothetical protein